MAVATAPAGTKPFDAWAARIGELGENIRTVRTAMADGRHEAEQCVAGTVSEVQQHPLRSLAVGVGAGVLAGYLIGSLLGWRTGVMSGTGSG